MAEQAYPTLNGEAQSWANITAVADLYDGPSIDLGEIGIKSLKWDVGLEVGAQRNTKGEIVKFTRGQATPSSSIGFYADGIWTFVEKLIDIAIAKGYVDAGVAKYGRVRFGIVVLHTPEGTTGIRKVTLEGCRLKKDVGDHGEGTDADESEHELVITRVVREINGKKGALL